MRYAMVDSACGHVINVVDWDEGNTQVAVPDGIEMVRDDPPSAGVGWRWDGTKFVPPAGFYVREEPPA